MGTLLLMFAQSLMGVVLSQQFIHTTAPSNRRETEIQIGDRIYTAPNICRKAAVGKSYPAKLENGHIELQMDDGKTCKYRITGERVTKSSGF
jgi:hypothetical protein